VRDFVFQSEWTDFLVRERPAIVERYFVVVETKDSELAVIYADYKLFRVIGPGKRVLLWKDAASFHVDLFNVETEPEVPARLVAPLERLGRESLVTFTTVEENRAGLLYLNNKLIRVLTAGRYGFWAVTNSPRVEAIDLRRQTADVNGQEILTRDKVSIRVNISAEYQVIDPVAARTNVRDYAEFLYRLLQLLVRSNLGTKTLEEILAAKTEVDGAVEAAVRAEMDGIGVRVGAVAIKDIVLPGDMREILNQVVSAEKQAQANLIRRREETAATRSLLNTAKLMEDNPILVRLKELETLEKLMEKVDRVSVSNGFTGLLDDLVQLR
jgi:regulator of protease activity HflC (stomatin/prohibitin superfamily)